jgi:wyosine [tRNA(Phe)-imidazoG37] synthetase (radical SAM superfamily)
MMNNDCTFKYKTLFGPVLSRRLGISLGVDLVRHKTCSMDCVYCECGATTHLTNKRKEYVPVDLVKAELTAYLSRNETIDCITFSGSGEPTLNEGIGDIIRFLKSDYPQYQLALLTNSSFLDQPSVRQAVMDVDVVMASLDVATEGSFKLVNRPHPSLDLNAIIEGIAAFRKMCRGRLIVECLLINDGNDSAAELMKLKTALTYIDAHGILLNTLDRPGTESWVQPVPLNRLKDISDFLEGAEIVKYGTTPPSTAVGHEDLLVRLIETVRRRPYTAQDVSQLMGLDVETVQSVLDQLVASRKLSIKRMDRGIFYKAF